MTRQKGAYAVKTEDEESWWWECNLCGWTGWDLHSSDQAMREAQRHQRDQHTSASSDYPKEIPS